jgi:hypothetical protein
MNGHSTGLQIVARPLSGVDPDVVADYDNYKSGKLTLDQLAAKWAAKDWGTDTSQPSSVADIYNRADAEPLVGKGWGQVDYLKNTGLLTFDEYMTLLRAAVPPPPADVIKLFSTPSPPAQPTGAQAPSGGTTHAVTAAYNPDEERDNHGRWGGGGSDSEKTVLPGKAFSNEREATSYINHTQGYLKKSQLFSDDDAAHVVDYTGMGGYGVNDALRSGASLSRDDQARVAAMDRIMGQTYWPKDFVTYRGVQDDGTFAALHPGDSFVDHGYSSTSLNPEVAEHFSTIDPDSRPIVMDVAVPAGTGAGIPTEPLIERIGLTPEDAQGDDELPFSRLNEVILPRDTTYTVVGKYQDGATTHLQVRAQR